MPETEDKSINEKNPTEAVDVPAPVGFFLLFMRINDIINKKAAYQAADGNRRERMK